ncbi:MAG: DAK2 domain-containing protein [Bacilli bacterium]|nr:DAK2 domain-containing protein [Bacillales bacterium]MDD7382035.1 DAK2 domain-containing protein [Bacillales bacterium]MDY2747005.1 DAK2 domain-containing protein [Bacilli bacterium]MDY6142365.1 DAK2 domain-containing protein [Bacilli bacterium]
MKYINGIMLKQMIISGANNLFNCYPEVDALNVFPVPDGDTGTNMNLTMSSGSKEIQNRTDEGVYDIAKSFSRGLLMGARGNSGVILSQIFRGFAQSLEGKEKIYAIDLADALVRGKEVAYKAVMKPVEGTILTVIRESSEALRDKVTDKMEIEKAMSILIEEAKASLERTPELLPVLKEVGVVDSGGAGLLKVFEGFEKAVNGYVVEKSMPTVTDSNPVVGANDEKEEIEFSYITEFVLRLAENPAEEGKKVYVEKRFANVLASHGSKISIAQDGNLLMVHISTLFPGTILSYAQQFGEFARVKIENTTESDENIEVPVKEETKQKEPMKEYALIAVSAGDGLESMFKELNVDIVVSGGQTMNPSTQDFVEAIKKANAKKVFILPNNSNIIMASSQACQVTEEGVEARVIPTKTIPQGLVSCMMFSEEASMDENEEAMTEAIANVKTGQVTYAIKDTSVDGVEVKKDQYIALFGKQIVCCYPDKLKATKEMIAKMIDEMSSIVTIILGEDATDDEGEALASLIQAKHPDVEVEVRRGNQPVYSFIIGVE